MDNLTEKQRIEKLNASITYSKQVWQHFVQNCHIDWGIVENKISSELSDTLKLQTKFEVKEVEDLEDNVCYVDGSSTEDSICIKFYCSPQIYSRAITIPIQVLANLEHVLWLHGHSIWLCATKRQCQSNISDAWCGLQQHDLALGCCTDHRASCSTHRWLFQ